MLSFAHNNALYACSDIISSTININGAVTGETIFTSSDIGSSVGRILDAMRTPLSSNRKHAVVDGEPTIFGVLTKSKIRTKWLAFVIFCFDATAGPILGAEQREDDPKRTILKYNKFVEAAVYQLHLILFRGIASIIYDANGTPVVLRLPTCDGNVCQLTANRRRRRSSKLTQFVICNRDLRYDKRYSCKCPKVPLGEESEEGSCCSSSSI